MTAEEYVVDELQVTKINLGKVETELRELYEKYNDVVKEYEEMHKFFYNRLNLEYWNGDDDNGYVRFNSIWHYDRADIEYVKKLFNIGDAITDDSDE